MFEFYYDHRLKISIPKLYQQWEDYKRYDQERILAQFEQSRGLIPERVQELELEIKKKQALLATEDCFDRSCELNKEIAEAASVITDLWIWYRLAEDLSSK